MNRSKVVSRAVVVALGVFGVAGVALAGQPHWAQDKWAKGKGHDRQYERGYRDSDYARVIDVDPIVRRVRVSEPQESCWVEEEAVRSGPARSEIRGTLIGGLIGAAVGHQLGRHHDVGPAAIVGGSMIGAAIGNGVGAGKAERRGEYVPVRYRDVERCQVNYRETWEERIDGYEVTYVYNGRKYTTVMPYDPGKRILVDVNVRPVTGRY
jgi:uncharacterized protein YcfJ